MLLLVIIVPAVMVVAVLYVGMSRFGLLPAERDLVARPTERVWPPAAPGRPWSEPAGRSEPAGIGPPQPAGAGTQPVGAGAQPVLRRYGYGTENDTWFDFEGRLADVPQGCLFAAMAAMALWVLGWLAILVVGLAVIYG